MLGQAGNDTRLEGDHSDGRASPAASSTDQAWREPPPQEQSQPQPQPQAGRFLFFARVPPAVPYDELLALFNKYGTVLDLNLYRRWASAKTSKGCGLVEFCAPSEAQAAMKALNGVFKFDGYQQEAPIVVEWMDAGRMAPPGGEYLLPCTGTDCTIRTECSVVYSDGFTGPCQQIAGAAH